MRGFGLSEGGSYHLEIAMKCSLLDSFIDSGKINMVWEMSWTLPDFTTGWQVQQKAGGLTSKVITGCPAKKFLFCFCSYFIFKKARRSI